MEEVGRLEGGWKGRMKGRREEGKAEGGPKNDLNASTHKQRKPSSRPQ